VVETDRFQRENTVVRQIHVEELRDLLATGAPVYLLDVRKPWEHDRAALPGSVLIPLDELADRADDVRPPPGALLVTYCHHGIRSLNAAYLLEQLGHAEVYSLAGGIDAWSLRVDATVPRY
jgi:adenylyltransferase/sulfurtransferase